MTLLAKEHQIPLTSETFNRFVEPLDSAMQNCTELESRGDRPLKFTFLHQLKAMLYYHLEEHDSGRHLLSALKNDELAASEIAPADGVSRGTFFEAINSRGVEQFIQIFEALQKKATHILPGAKEYERLGDIVAVDGSLIDACLSMLWADYRKGSKKAKVHLGFNVSKGLPTKVFLTDGKADERIYADKIIQPGQTGALDRYYQCHKNLDKWQRDSKHFVVRIKVSSRKTVIRENLVKPDGIIFYDSIVLLGTKGVNRTQKEVRVVGYKVDQKEYWVATDRFDLSAEDIALIYKLRWTIESFFKWWKHHLKVYHLIARSHHGLLVQILSGLITYLLLAIYCKEKHDEKVSIKRVRELVYDIRNDIIRQSLHSLYLLNYFLRYSFLNANT